MMWLMESPLAILGVGVAVLAVLFVALQQTGKKGILLAMLITTLLFAGLLVLERSVVTDRESVEATLQEIAGALETNDIDLVVSHISESAPEITSDAKRYLRMGTIQEVKIKKIHSVELRMENPPPVASVDFNVLIVAEDRSGALGTRRVPKRLKVVFCQEGGAWRVSKYKMEEVIGPRR
jgi:hypothetical protein